MAGEWAPEGRRSRAKRTVRSNHVRIAPTAPSAMSSRSHWKFAMISAKPSCSLPSRLSSGTKTSSKAISPVSDACQPILGIGEALTPARVIRRMPFMPSRGSQ
jgi:hypothetical protein